MEEDIWKEITDLRANGSLSHFLSYFSGVGLSSPFLKILPYEVARGWVEGLNGHKVSVEGAANMSNFFNILRNERICMLGRA